MSDKTTTNRAISGGVPSGGNRRPVPPPLPFTSGRKMSFGEWVYRHQLGLMVTIVIHLTLAIVFLTYQIIIKPPQPQFVSIDMVNEALTQPEQEIEQQKVIEKMEQMENVKVQNRSSDQNAKLNATLKDDRNSKSSQIYEEAQKVQDALASGSDAYRKGLSEIEAMEGKKINRQESSRQNSRSTSKDSKEESSKYSGNVTVTYDLPGRVATYLHVPAYQCEGGGQVVVRITVNNNGRVLTASVEKATNTDDNCILEMAVQAAKATTFNVSSSAPDKQRGTITYIFVPQ